MNDFIEKAKHSHGFTCMAAAGMVKYKKRSVLTWGKKERWEGIS